MKTAALALLLITLIGAVSSSHAQAPREDAIWARTTTDTIVLDGVLDEAAWSQAETMVMDYGVSAGIPGSGWKIESGNFIDVDPVHATLKLLVKDNQLYLGAVVEDASIGGAAEFNRFDGFLMAIKDHADIGPIKPPAEYFYSWWYAESVDPQPTGQDPAFVGRWAEWPPGTARTAEQIANWDAVTIVDGLSNDDTTDDTSYTVEMRFNLSPMGYDTTVPEGDIVEWNISIYDCDYFWPIDPLRFITDRVWWQGPWGNVANYSEVRVHARPDVTTESGPVPTIGPEIVINEIVGDPITVDGNLSEAAWTDPDVYSFDIRWDDDVLRESYPGVARWRAGQYQPDVNGGAAFVVDPGDATVKIFFEGDTLYMGFDVRDQAVQFHPVFDRWDGFLISLDDRAELSPDNNLLGRRISFQVSKTGDAEPQDYLLSLLAANKAEIGLTLKANTVVDTLATIPDEGYTAELAIDLTGVGYPPGLGDQVLFLGVNHLDGDSFPILADSYGTRTWWMKEYDGTCCPAWIHMQKSGIGVAPSPLPGAEYRMVNSFPNPSIRPTIQYSLAHRSHVQMEVYDVRGRLVERRELGAQGEGLQEFIFDGRDHPAGMYMVRLRVSDPASGSTRASLQGKMILVK